MNNEKDIQRLHDRGFVILQASRSTNAPIGWKHRSGKWGYVDEMADASLKVYRSTFKPVLLARSHCGFYLGHGNLCCIDLDTKKTTAAITTAVKDKLIAQLGSAIAVEQTKSAGWHIYFLYKERLDNCPDWMGLGKANWIELYYSKRFIACYLSNSKKYQLVHGELLKLKPLTAKQHDTLLKILTPYKGKNTSTTAAKTKTKRVYDIDAETWQRAESYTAQIEKQGIDITGDNPVWFKIGKAMAHAFGGKGFELFNRVSQFAPTYNADTIQEQYDRFVADDARRNKTAKAVTIGSFFKLCEDAGLADLETLNAVALHEPAAAEFELKLTKKERMPEHVHTLVAAFLQHVQLCYIDSANFYMYEHTHWVRRNAKQVVDVINSFVDRSDVEDRYRKILRTVPYLEMALKELRLTTLRDALEPHTGNLNEGIYVNMENGVLHINMKTGKRRLLDHESKYNFTTLLPYGYEPTATCPRFDAWLDRQVPDKDLQLAYYAFVASCLTKHKADIIMLLVGDTSTGKSSLIDITRRVIGIENSVAISAGTLFGGTPDAQTVSMQMENKLLAYDFDSQPFKHLEMLLKVAAQEPLPGWQMHVARRPVINYGRLLIAMNRYSYSVFNPAVARRFVTVNMDSVVAKDNSVMPAIYENELAGIFNHVLNKGVKHLIENNGQIHVTERMRAATLQAHTADRDAVRWFNSKYFILKWPSAKDKRTSIALKLYWANDRATVVHTTVSAMYAEYRAWCEDVEGIQPSRIQLRKHFAADLKLIGIEEYNSKMDNNEQKWGVFVGSKDS